MDWEADICEAEGWYSLLVRIYNGRNSLNEKAFMYDPILIHHVESEFYNESDRDMFLAVKCWRDVLYTNHLYEIATPDNIVEIHDKKTAATKLYESNVGYLEGLYKLREMYEIEEPTCKELVYAEVELQVLQLLNVTEDKTLAFPGFYYDILDGFGYISIQNLDTNDSALPVDIRFGLFLRFWFLSLSSPSGWKVKGRKPNWNKGTSYTVYDRGKMYY